MYDRPDSRQPHDPQQADSTSLCDLIYQKVLERILSGEYPARSKLPTEVQLSEELGVSRPVLRQALAKLRDDNLIVSRRGSGSYVRATPDSAMLAYAPISSIQDIQRCFEFRTGIEGEIAALAAERHNDESLKQIKRGLDQINEKLRSGTSSVDADYNFHLAVCNATQNKYYVKAFASLYENIRVGMQLTSYLSNRKPTKRFHLIREEHGAVFEAIRKRDPEEARATMRLHIANARQRMFESDE